MTLDSSQILVVGSEGSVYLEIFSKHLGLELDIPFSWEQREEENSPIKFFTNYLNGRDYLCDCQEKSSLPDLLILNLPLEIFQGVNLTGDGKNYEGIGKVFLKDCLDHEIITPDYVNKKVVMLGHADDCKINHQNILKLGYDFSGKTFIKDGPDGDAVKIAGRISNYFKKLDA